MKPDDIPLIYTDASSQDVNLAAAALDGWNQEYDQVDMGLFQGSLEHLSGPGVQLFRERLNISVAQLATTPKKQVSILVPLHLSGQRTSDQARNICAEGITLLPFESDIFWVCGQSSDYVVVSIAVELLEPLLCEADLNALLQAQRSYAVHLPAHRLVDLQQTLPLLLHQHLQGDRHILSTELHSRSLQHYLADTLLDLYTGYDNQGNKRDWRPLGNQHHYIVRQSMAFIDSEEGLEASVLDICKALNTPRRTLNYSFERVTGMAPSRYLRSVRLNRVRREVLTSSEPIGSIAARYGFFHAGYFGKEYRRLFGESASQTRTSRICVPIARSLSSF
jgi:AraC-like DNA-binding protein